MVHDLYTCTYEDITPMWGKQTNFIQILKHSKTMKKHPYRQYVMCTGSKSTLHGIMAFYLYSKAVSWQTCLHAGGNT